MTDALRDYLEQRFAKVRSGYGASDLTIGMAGESDFTVWLRHRLRTDDGLRARLLGPGEHRIPMVFQYNPLETYLETTDAGEVLCTINNTAVKRAIEADGPGWAEAEPAWRVERIRLPLLFLFGRKDTTISYMGANIYPQDVEYGLYRGHAMAHLIEGFCLSLEEYTDLESRPVVEDRQGLRDFCALPLRLHPADRYVPIARAVIARWWRGDGPEARHGPVRLYLVRTGSGEVVGRTCVHRNAAFDAKRARRHQLFGLTEFIDDSAVTDVLVELIAKHGEDADVRFGPVGLLPNQTGGVITAGFADRGFVDSAWNPPYYPAAYEGHGFSRRFEADTWLCELGDADPDTVFPFDDGRIERERLVIRYGSRRHFDAQLAILRTMLNASFAQLGYYTEIAADELAVQTDGLSYLLDEALLMWLEKAGEPVAFIVTVPDISQFLVRVRGDETAHRVARLVPAETPYETPFSAATVLRRRCARGPYLPGQMTPEVLARARAYGAELRTLPCRPLAAPLSRADRWLFGTPDVVDELRVWLRLTPHHPRYRLDGLTDRALALSRVEAAGLRAALSPPAYRIGRRFGVPALLAAGARGLLRYDGSVAVLVGNVATPEDLLGHGRALPRVWLALTEIDVSVHPLSQLLDCATTAEEVRTLLDLGSHESALAIFRTGRPRTEPVRSARIAATPGVSPRR